MALTTTAKFRRFSGFDIRDAFTGTADSGTTTTLVDSILTQVDDYWNNHQIHITGGTNAGRSRVVTDFVASSDTITVSPAFPSAIDNTSIYELVPDNSQEISEQQVSDFITIADKTVMQDVAVYVEKERVDGYAPQWSAGSDSDEGEINGTNAVFFVNRTPIADWDASTVVDTSDIRVDVLGDNDAWSENVSVSSVDDFTGKITLSSAPGSGAERVLVSYAYYPTNQAPDASLLERASNCQVGLQVLDTKARDMATLTWSSGSGMLRDPLEAKRAEFNAVYRTTIRRITRGEGYIRSNDYRIDLHGGPRGFGSWTLGEFD